MFKDLPEFDVKAGRLGIFDPGSMFTWTGRRTRKGFFLLAVVIKIMSFPLEMLLFNSMRSGDGVTLIWLALLLMVSYMAFCNMAKRLHDIGHTLRQAGLVFIVGLVITCIYLGTGIHAFAKDHSGVGMLVLAGEIYICGTFLYCVFHKGEAGDNPYGPDILGEKRAEGRLAECREKAED